MPRKQDFTKHAVNLRIGDYNRLQEFGEAHGLHASFIIRRLVSRFVDDLDKAVNEQELGKINIQGALQDD